MDKKKGFKEENDFKEQSTFDEKDFVVIDCLGEICPLPVMRLQKLEEALSQGLQIKIITDHSCASENLINYCRLHTYKIQVVEPISGVWEIFVNV